jgi:CubicO group peptidase (beta-lactamase class C family)
LSYLRDKSYAIAMKVGAACLAGVLAIVASSAAAAEGPPRNLDELRARVARVLLRERVPGAGIALVDGDHVLWAGGVGLADRERGKPVTADTLFRVGSITKSFISLALVKLAEQGRIDLRARVSDVAPEIAIGNRWDAEQPITVAHLLEHTAGFDDMRPNEAHAPLSAEGMPLVQVLARNPGSRVARWRPGSRFSYANPGYTVAGYLIEKVTGESYERVLERDLLAPLGMTGAALRLAPEVDARLARGYDDGDGPVAYRTLYHRPAGNLMASPRELAALVQLCLARGRFGGAAVISPGGMARIERSETARLDSGDASYGLGNSGLVYERAPIRGHNGYIEGFVSSYGYLPEQGVGYVLLLNSTRSASARLEIRHLLVEYLLAGAPVVPPPRAVVPEDELRRWVGTYHGAAPRHQRFAFLDRVDPGLELLLEAGRLYVRQVPDVGQQLELVPLGRDRFRLAATSAGHITFGRDREGRRSLVADNAYFVEEPRSRVLAYVIVPLICLWVLATGLLLPLALFRRRVGPSAALGWPLATTLSLFALPRLFIAGAEARALGEPNMYTVGVFVLTLVFALGSMGSAVQALTWLVRPGSVFGKLHRLAFALAACTTTAYLGAYGIIGIRLWS